MRISDWSSDVCSSDLASEVAQRLAHILFGIGGHVLHDRAVAFDRDVHAIFVIIAAAMRDARAQLIEIAALDRTERIGDALKLDILGRVAADRRRCAPGVAVNTFRSAEHTSELQSLMRISYAVFCLKKNKKAQN